MFNIGDLITVGEYVPTQYTVTNQESVCKVLDLAEHHPHSHIRTGDIFVEVVKHSTRPRFIGNTYWVESKYFVPYIQTREAHFGALTALFE